jgi:plastocyanin
MKKFAVLLALVLSAFVIVACGDSDSDTTGGTTPATTTEEKTEEAGGGNEGGVASNELQIEADPDGGLAYTTDEATAKAGKLEVDLINESPVPHDVAIEDEGGKEIGKTEVIAEGEDSTAVTLKPGEYTFYCSVPGHREAGMEGTLTVE